jgi:ubiquitin thioesterase protein OTUB1
MRCQERLTRFTDYEASSSPVFAAKVLELLSSGYTALRRVRGDGSCLYRSVLFGILEHLALRPPSTRAASAERLKASVRRAKAAMLQSGYEEAVLEDPLMVIEQLIEAASGDAPLTPDLLVARFCEQGSDAPYGLWLLRMCASAEVRFGECTPFTPSLSASCRLSPPDSE